MPFWNRQKPASVAALSPPLAPVLPELDELARLLPYRDDNGRFFWQDYVDRIIDRFDGLPAPDGSASFVRECLAAGCRAVPVMERSRLWEMEGPPRPLYEMRIRLGLFFAASLRYLLHGLCKLRVRADRSDWHVLAGDRLSYREFVQAHDSAEPRISWSKSTPQRGQVYVLASFFFQRREILLLTHELAAEVLDCAGPEDPGLIPGGLFGRMLSYADQVPEVEVDVAGVFLEALAQAVEKKYLRVNTRMGGHLFVTPAFWLLTTPVGLDCVTELLRTRVRGSRHDFTRHEVYRALREAGCLVDAAAGGRDTARCVLSCGAWKRPLELRGLRIASGALPGRPVVATFDGSVTLRAGD